MSILTKTIPFVSACVLLSHLPAFAWSNSSSFSNTRVASVGSTKAISAVSSTDTSSSRSWGSPAYYSSSSDLSSLPASFQSIISKFDISQSVVPSEATIQQGLTEALAINNNYLEGNEYKAAMIQPLCDILDSGKYSAKTNNLVLQNLAFISGNDRINAKDKLEMTDSLIDFMEESVQLKNYSDETLESFHNCLRYIFFDPGVSADERDKITSKLINQDSPLWGDAQVLYSVFIALEEYMVSEETGLDIKNTIIQFNIGMLNIINSTSNLIILNEFIRGLAAATQDSRLSKATLVEIKNAIQGVLNNTEITLGYSQNLSCLAVLYSIANNDKLNTIEKKETLRTLINLGVNEQNKTIWEKYGTLVLVKPEVAAQVDNKTIQDLEKFIGEIPAGKRPMIVSLQDAPSVSLTDSQNTGIQQGLLDLVGMYDSAVMTVDLTIDSSFSLKNDYVFHETSHSLQHNIMTTEQIEEWNRLWLESDSLDDFMEEYSTTNKAEDGATIMETVLKEYYLPDSQKTLLKRAQEQNEANDPTLLNKYRLAEACWGIPVSSIN